MKEIIALRHFSSKSVLINGTLGPIFSSLPPSATSKALGSKIILDMLCPIYWFAVVLLIAAEIGSLNTRLLYLG